MSSLVCKGKKTWPELVGENGHHAAGIIERQNHHVRAIVVPTGSPARSISDVIGCGLSSTRMEQLLMFHVSARP
ncbi:unnamed protein product [Rhodiola kirilowii]